MTHFIPSLVPNKRQRSPESSFSSNVQWLEPDFARPSSEPQQQDSSNWTRRPQPTPKLTSPGRTVPYDSPWRPQSVATPAVNTTPDYTVQPQLGSGCSICFKVVNKTPRLVSDIQVLQSELAKLSVGEGDTKLEESQKSPEPEGLIRTIDWTIERLNESIRLTRAALLTQFGKEKQPSETLHPEYGSKQALGIERNRDWESHDGTRGKAPTTPPITDSISRRPELPPLFMDDSSRSIPSGSPPLSNSQCSIPGQATIMSTSLSSSEPTRHRYPSLPSPASLSVTSSVLLPPISPSVAGPANTRSPLATQLEDVQQQVSTKTLAHKALSTEHEKLLAAYSRLQARCATLDKKSAVSDREISTLVDDRIRLQSDLEVAESRVAELQIARDEAQEREAADSDQYLRIMTMCSQLQAKGAEESKKWKEEREALSLEREHLLGRIDYLEASAGRHLRPDHDGNPLLSGNDRASASTSVPTNRLGPSSLRTEIPELRNQLAEEQARTKLCKEDGLRLIHISKELGSIGDRLAHESHSSYSHSA